MMDDPRSTSDYYLAQRWREKQQQEYRQNQISWVMAWCVAMGMVALLIWLT